MAKERRILRRELAIGGAALAAMLLIFALRPAPIDRLELTLLDWRFQVRGPEEPQTPVGIVAIDAESLDVLGRWPWSRDVVAVLIDQLSAAGVAAIGVDVVFAETETPATSPLHDAVSALRERRLSDELVPMRSRLEEALVATDTDSRLEQSIESSDRTALGYFFRTSGSEIVRPDLDEDSIDRALRRGRLVVRGEEPAQAEQILTCHDVEPSLERFNKVAERMGFVNALKDPDGAIRRAALVSRCGEGLYPALSVATLEAALGRRAVVEWGESGLSALRFGELVVPLDDAGTVLVNHRGPPKTFPHFSALDVIEGRVGAEELAGAVMLIGPTEVAERDTHATPFSASAPGVETHATLIDNMLTGQTLYADTALVLDLALVLLAGIITLIAVPWLGTALRGAIFASFMLAALVAGALYAFLEHGLWLNLAYPGLTIVVVYLAIAVTQGAAQEARTRFIRQRFATFVPPDVVNEMVENPDSLELGGQRKEISILFSDIRGFTTIAEELGAEATTTLLNEYLTPMTQILFASRGTLDKYIGDAIVAFWGAPLPVPEHPIRAAEVALEMQESCAELRARGGELRGAEKLRIGIGIHTGEVVVGTMGSELRFDYTMTGDGVNLCARLEGLTKYYGAEILTSADLVAELPPGFLVRELDSIRVKGKTEPVTIFELLAKRLPDAAEEKWLAAFAEGLRLYRAGDFGAARAALLEASGLRGLEPADRAAALLIERMDELGEAPAGWDGIWNMDAK